MNPPLPHHVDAIDHVKRLEMGVFVYGEHDVEYQIMRLPPDTKRRGKITIKVHPDLKVTVAAPRDATKQQINEAIYKQARWIWQHLESFQNQHTHVRERQYISGETYFYLGRRYQLKILIDADYAVSTKMRRGTLEVRLPCALADQRSTVKAMLDRWYHQNACRIFWQRIQVVMEPLNWVQQAPDFQVMPMQKQWGSCSAEGRLMLNPHLIKAPRECIDYVLLHELCHIAEHNHSEKFWLLLSQYMPDWKAKKSKLDSMAELYLNH